MEKSNKDYKKTTKKRQSKNYDPFRQNRAPFQEKWINEAYEKLIYPNQNCVTVMEKINKVLPRYVVKSQTSEQKQQALFQLLGDHFTENHFPKHKIRKDVLEPPKMNTQTKKKYLKDMKTFLGVAVTNSMEDCGYNPNVIEHKGKNDELDLYLQEIRSSFKNAFESRVALDAFDTESKELLKEKEKEEVMLKRQASSSRHDDDDSEDSEPENVNKDDGFDDKIGITYTYEGDSAAKAFLAFMAFDSSKAEYYKDIICRKWLCLPLSLRQKYWYGFFIEKESDRLKLKPGDNYKKAIERDFENSLKEQMKKNKIKRSSRGPNFKYINAHIIELFDGVKSLEDLNTDYLMIESSLIVNMVDIQSDNYTPINCLLVLPLIGAFPKPEKEDDNDYAIFLATQLSFVIRYGKLSPQDIFNIGDDVIKTIKDEDPAYLDHIVRCLSNQTSKSRAIDFPPEVFIEDTAAATKLYNNLMTKGKKEAQKIQERYADVLIDPRLFVRKWIGQLFVGVLSLNAMMWAWDQLFMRGFPLMLMKYISLGILALIKPWMYRAEMHSGARKVLLEEPSKLYTSDIRNAVLHLEKGSLFTQIPSTKNFLEKKLSPKKKPEEKVMERQPKIAVPVKPFDNHKDFFIDIDFTMDNFNDYEPLPVPEPKPDDPDSEDDDNDAIVRQQDPNEPPTPPDTPPPTPSKKAWVEKDLHPYIPVQPCRINEPFDIYVDYVRFLPDHILICKVTGRIMNSGLPKEYLKDIHAFPILSSYRRSPTFKFTITIDPKDEKFNSKAVIIFKIYGYQDFSDEIVVVGSCLFGLYELINKKYMLKTGGHQLKLRYGGPKPQGGIQNLKESDLNHNSLVPGASLCFRLLKADKIYDPTPRYEDAFYESSSAKPNNSEYKLIQHYIDMEDYSILQVSDVLKDIQKFKKVPVSEDDNDKLQNFMFALLNHRAAQKNRTTPIPDLDYARYILYDQRKGVNICIQGAFGLPDNAEDYYLHALAEYYPGKDTNPDVSNDQRESYKILTRRIDLLSPRRSPDWLDLKTTIKPPYDDNGVVMVRVYGIRPKYIPLKDEEEEENDFLEDLKGALDGEEGDDRGNEPSGGIVQPRDKDAFFIDYDEPLYWGVLQIFDSGSVLGGLHSIVLFEGHPSQVLLEEMETRSPLKVLRKWISNKIILPLKYSLLEVELWDGHIESEDIPEPASDIQLREFGIKEFADQSRTREYDAKFADFVFEDMSGSVKSNGSSDSKYVSESYLFQKEANKQLVISLNAALRFAGKKELRYEESNDYKNFNSTIPQINVASPYQYGVQDAIYN